MRELPEIECRSRFFPVRVRGSEAIQAVNSAQRHGAG
jgi:hypothetical protein